MNFLKNVLRILYLIKYKMSTSKNISGMIYNEIPGMKSKEINSNNLKESIIKYSEYIFLSDDIIPDDYIKPHCKTNKVNDIYPLFIIYATYHNIGDHEASYWILFYIMNDCPTIVRHLLANYKIDIGVRENMAVFSKTLKMFLLLLDSSKLPELKVVKIWLRVFVEKDCY